MGSERRCDECLVRFSLMDTSYIIKKMQRYVMRFEQEKAAVRRPLIAILLNEIQR